MLVHVLNGLETNARLVAQIRARLSHKSRADEPTLVFLCSDFKNKKKTEAMGEINKALLMG